MSIKDLENVLKSQLASDVAALGASTVCIHAWAWYKQIQVFRFNEMLKYAEFEHITSNYLIVTDIAGLDKFLQENSISTKPIIPDNKDTKRCELYMVRVDK